MRTTVTSAYQWARELDREAAWDSARNIAAAIGATTLIGELTTMNPLWMPFAVIVLTGAWYADYLRHF